MTVTDVLKLIQDNEIKGEIDEVKDYVKGMLVQQYAQYGMPTPDDEALEANVDAMDNLGISGGAMDAARAALAKARGESE